jgi:small subunit ribosomal protein S14
MKYLNKKDFFRRNLYLNIEFEYLRVKALTFNATLPKTVRFFFLMKLTRMSKNMSKVRIKNRCIFTNKSQSVYRNFRINRSVLKNFVGSDLLVGIRKSSW